MCLVNYLALTRFSNYSQPVLWCILNLGREHKRTLLFLLWFLHLLLMLLSMVWGPGHPLIFLGWLLISPLHTSLDPPLAINLVADRDPSGLMYKCLTSSHQCRDSRIWKENLAKTHSIKLGTQTNAYRGCEVGQEKSNTQGVSELWQRVATLRPKIFRFSVKRQNTNLTINY